MSYPLRLFALLALAGLAGCATTTPSAPAPATAARAELKPLDEDRLNEAKMLNEERRYLEAAAIFEEQAKLQPENAELVARQAHLFSMQARAEIDPVKAKVLYKRARELAEQAESLGADDPLTPMILASVQPDGSTEPVAVGAFSKHEQADKLIREGESAFTRHDFAKARESYQQAYELEPTNYMAALWTGDGYLASGQPEPACEWYRKAIAVEPNKETAHRYLGDALAKLGRREEALNAHIAALLCEPYQRLTRQHFPEGMRARAEARGRVIPRFPALRVNVDAKKDEIQIGETDDTILASYFLVCAGWRRAEFSARYSMEKGLRRSLPEETTGLEFLAACRTDEKEEDAKEVEMQKKWQPVIAGLAAFKRDGLLEAYAFFERADADLAKDYAAYRAAHRDKLERYVRVYWCGFE